MDDEPELREVLLDLLAGMADEIVTASNGIEGMQLLETQKFHAVLSDEKMPKKSGLDVLIWMRDHNIKIPFIFQTGFGQKDIIQQAQKLDAFAFIEKPWNENTLLSTISNALHAGLEQEKRNNL